MEQLFASVDAYCERTGAGLWAEPLNALTNLAFIAAGLWGLGEARRRQAGAFVAILCWWVVAIGVGSGLFHTAANRLTGLADVIPIAVFTLLYTVFALRRFVGLGWAAAVSLCLAFHLAAGAATAMLPDEIDGAANGSTAYFPALLGFVTFSAILLARGHPAGRFILAGAAIFLVSLCFRTADPAVCAAFPLGTHFLWHLLNAAMLATLLAAAARHGGRRAVAAPAARPRR